MGSYNLDSDFQAEVDVRLEGLTDKLDNADKQRLIKQALLDYSRHRPDRTAVDITGDGTFDYSIADDLPDFEVGFSVIEGPNGENGIEYPYDSTDADQNWLDPIDWEITHDTSEEVLRFKGGIVPTSSETIRVHHTLRYQFSSGAVTIPDGDFYAICDRGAALCLRAIASKFVSTGNSSLGVDSVNYRTKSGEALRSAEAYDKAFRQHLGISDGPSENSAAVVVTDVDTEYSFGADYLTHSNRYR